jgi:MFS transporter, SP family, sugar:H+ symporter
LFGALIAAPLSDKFGRRRNMIAACMVFYVGNTIQITAVHAWYQIAIGRFITGLAVGSLSGISFSQN